MNPRKGEGVLLTPPALFFSSRVAHNWVVGFIAIEESCGAKCTNGFIKRSDKFVEDTPSAAIKYETLEAMLGSGNTSAIDYWKLEKHIWRRMTLYLPSYG